ncbi:MAG: hypothetical protein RIG67_22455 [Rhodospirillales bacterium]
MFLDRRNNDVSKDPLAPLAAGTRATGHPGTDQQAPFGIGHMPALAQIIAFGTDRFVQQGFDLLMQGIDFVSHYPHLSDLLLPLRSAIKP